jgi:hypothetical protein
MYVYIYIHTYNIIYIYIYAGENLAFSRERKEMRDNFDKDAKAMKRQIEILQVSLYVGVTPHEAASNTSRGCC